MVMVDTARSPVAEAGEGLVQATRRAGVEVVGGPGFEPGASRSRTVLVVCPRVSSGVRDGLPELNFRRLCVLKCPAMTASFRECVTRL